MLFERLLKDIRQAKSNMESIILHGQIDDFTTYKFLVGQIKGLQDAIDICQQTFKRYDNEE